MKAWIVCVLLCAVFTSRTTTAAAIETRLEQDQNLSVEDKEEYLKTDAAVNVSKSGACPHGWIKYDSRCFRLMRSSLSWIKAEAQCAVEQARLASIHNIGEHRFLQNLLEMAGISQAWIGAFYFQGSWLWADTTRFYYNNWSSLNSVSSYPCAYIKNNAGWSNINCANGYAYFCAIDLTTC